MRSAIILLDKENDLELAYRPVLDRSLIEWVVRELKIAEIEDICIVTKDTQKIVNDAKVVANLYEAINSLDAINADVLILDSIYPNMKSETYTKMFDYKNTRISGTHIIKLNVKDIIKIKETKFDEISVSQDELKVLSTYKEVYELNRIKRLAINEKHLANGVNLFDLEHTYIGPDVMIAKDATVYPNVYLEGDTTIGENTVIYSDSYLKNAKIGNNNAIISSRITDSEIKNNVTLGPNSHLRMNTVVEDGVRIGNYVEFKNTTFGVKSKCAHLTYLGDSTIGDDVNIGCGVVTVNYDGAHKFRTKIGDHSFIGSNANLIAPIEIGSNAVIAAGSTVYQDVEDNDMAIARSYQVNKKGRGYTYVNKEK